MKQSTFPPETGRNLVGWACGCFWQRIQSGLLQCPMLQASPKKYSHSSELRKHCHKTWDPARAFKDIQLVLIQFHPRYWILCWFHLRNRGCSCLIKGSPDVRVGTHEKLADAGQKPGILKEIKLGLYFLEEKIPCISILLPVGAPMKPWYLLLQSISRFLSVFSVYGGLTSKITQENRIGERGWQWGKQMSGTGLTHTERSSTQVRCGILN